MNRTSPTMPAPTALAPLIVTRAEVSALGSMYRIPDPEGLGERMVRAGLWVYAPDSVNTV